MMVNNFSNIIKAKEHLLPKLFAHKTTTYDVGDPSPGLELTIFTKNNKNALVGLVTFWLGLKKFLSYKDL